MSDFDREAERERLREQFERDKQKREAAEQMSELLLQGATMTNRHCPECHSPVFRYDGREFCPTCQREVTDLEAASDDTGREAQPAENGAVNDTPTDTHGEPASSTESTATTSEETGRHPPTAPGDDQPTQSAAADGRDADETVSPSETHEEVHDANRGRDERRPATSRDRRPARVDPPARRDVASSDDGDLREAEAALIREITALVHQAEETADIGRKRELFTTAREAADALQTLSEL